MDRNSRTIDKEKLLMNFTTVPFITRKPISLPTRILPEPKRDVYNSLKNNKDTNRINKKQDKATKPPKICENLSHNTNSKPDVSTSEKNKVSIATQCDLLSTEKTVSDQPINSRSCLEFIKQLISNEDLQVNDVETILRKHQQELFSNFPKPKIEIIKTENAEITADFAPDLIVNNEIIIINDDSDEEEEKRPQQNKRRKIHDSGLPSSASDCSSYSPNAPNNIQVYTLYAQPTAKTSDTCEDYFLEEYWEAPAIQVGKEYLVPSATGKTWVKVILIERITDTRFKVIDLKTNKIIVVSWRHLAQFEPVKNLLKVGSRVIAGFRKFGDTLEVKRGRGVYKSGIVVEIPNGYNRFRYLVVFDTCEWLYVYPDSIRPIFHNTRRSWKHVKKCCQKEVKHFLKEKFVNKSNFKEGDNVKVYNSEVTPGVQCCRVIAIDCSLVLLSYYDYVKAEWIHKHSSRIEPL